MAQASSTHKTPQKLVSSEYRARDLRAIRCCAARLAVRALEMRGCLCGCGAACADIATTPCALRRGVWRCARADCARALLRRAPTVCACGPRAVRPGTAGV